MEFINEKIIELLIKERSELCISAYMPAHRIWNEIDQDLLRYKNLLKRIERDLNQENITLSKREHILTHFKALQNDFDFWRYRQDGLALFGTEKEFYYIKLPIRFEEDVFIGEQFHILPLIPALTETFDFYILLLDQKDMKLFRSHHFALRPVTVPGLPKTVEEAVGYDNPGRNLQYRQGIYSGGAGGVANFHGTGVDTDASKQKDNILEYFRKANEAVMHKIGSEFIPLVLAGVEYLHPLYREVNTYPNLFEKGITKKITMGEEEIYSEARELLQTYFKRVELESLQLYGNLKSTGRTSVDIAEIVKAAFSKRISHLFIDPAEKQWGSFDFQNFDVIINNKRLPGDIELFSLSVSSTIQNNGLVFLLDKNKMPNGKGIAAIFRY